MTVVVVTGTLVDVGATVVVVVSAPATLAARAHSPQHQIDIMASERRMQEN